MKTKAAARSLCTGCLLGASATLFFSSTATSCDAFVLPSGRSHVLSATQRHYAATPAGSLLPLALLRTRNIFSRDGINGGGTLGQGARRTRNHSSSKGGSSDCCAMSASSSGSGESASGLNPFSAPSGPGAGVINLEFRDLKAGGFKVFLLFFLLGVSWLGMPLCPLQLCVSFTAWYTRLVQVCLKRVAVQPDTW